MSAKLNPLDYYSMPCRRGFNCKKKKENRCKFNHPKLCKYGYDCKFNKHGKCKFHHQKICEHGSDCEMYKENKCNFNHQKFCKWCDIDHDSSEHICYECDKPGHEFVLVCFTCKNNNTPCDQLLTNPQHLTNDFQKFVKTKFGTVFVNTSISGHLIQYLCPESSLALEKCSFCNKYGCGYHIYRNHCGYLSKKCENSDEIIEEHKSKVDTIFNEQLTSTNEDSPNLPNELANIVGEYIHYNVCRICCHPISTDDTIFKTHEKSCLAEDMRIEEMVEMQIVKNVIPYKSKILNPENHNAVFDHDHDSDSDDDDDDDDDDYDYDYDYDYEPDTNPNDGKINNEKMLENKRISDEYREIYDSDGELNDDLNYDSDYKS